MRRGASTFLDIVSEVLIPEIADLVDERLIDSSQRLLLSRLIGKFTIALRGCSLRLNSIAGGEVVGVVKSSCLGLLTAVRRKSTIAIPLTLRIWDSNDTLPTAESVWLLIAAWSWTSSELPILLLLAKSIVIESTSLKNFASLLERFYVASKALW